MKDKKRQPVEIPDDIDFFEPDRHRLDEEWALHPKRARQYANALAEATRNVAVSKAHLELVRAELGQMIREDPNSFELPKVTENSIAETIVQQKRYQQANDKLIKAKYEEDILSGAVKAMSDRRKALENLVWLHSQDYYAEPHAPPGTEEATEEMLDRSVSKKVRAKLNRKK